MTPPTGPEEEGGVGPRSHEAGEAGTGETDARAPEEERRPDHRSADRRTEEAGDRLEQVLSEHREAAEEAEEPPPYDPFAPIPEAEETEGEDDGLPDAPLFALLRTLAEEITTPRIDRVWIFPPRRIEVGETAVVVVTSHTGLDDDRRRVHAAHYTALDDADQHRLAVDEFGTAPADRVGRLVEEAVERIKDAPPEAPRSIRVEGDERRWDEMLHALAEQYMEERQRDRRFRP